MSNMLDKLDQAKNIAENSYLSWPQGGQVLGEATTCIENLANALHEYMVHDADYSNLNKLGDHTKSHRWKKAHEALKAL